MKVLGIGEVVIDNVYSVDAPVYAHHKPASGLVDRCIGGPVPSALTLLSRLGVECTFMAGIGEDESGDLIREHCTKEGISLISQSQLFTQNNIILVPKATGERIKIRGKTRRKPLMNLDAHFLAQFDLILIDRHEPKAFYEIMAKKQKRTQVVIDPSTEVSTTTLDMIRMAEVPVVPIETVCRIGQKSFLENLQAVYDIAQKPLIVTAGKLGTILFNGSNMEIQPSYDVAVVDTLGAGDIFRGALAFGLLQKWDLHKSVDFGNLVAALQCTKIGNVSAIPNERQIRHFAKKVTLRQVQFQHIQQQFIQLTPTLC